MKIIDLELVSFPHLDTPKAYAIKQYGDEDEEIIWLPRSQVERDESTRASVGAGTTHEYMVPEWLAIEKGLV